MNRLLSMFVHVHLSLCSVKCVDVAFVREVVGSVIDCLYCVFIFCKQVSADVIRVPKFRKCKISLRDLVL